MPDTGKVKTAIPQTAGAIWRAPIGTTLPTDASTALAAAFEDMGYVSEDGVTNSNSPDTEKIKEWGGQTVLVVVNEKSDSFKLKLLEALNENVLETVYGAANVTVGTNVIAVVSNAAALGEYVYVIDMKMGTALKRIVIPNGSLSEIGDIIYRANEPVGYELTLEALPDSSGNNHYEYIKTA